MNATNQSNKRSKWVEMRIVPLTVYRDGVWVDPKGREFYLSAEKLTLLIDRESERFLLTNNSIYKKLMAMVGENDLEEELMKAFTEE